MQCNVFAMQCNNVFTMQCNAMSLLCNAIMSVVCNVLKLTMLCCAMLTHASADLAPFFRCSIDSFSAVMTVTFISKTYTITRLQSIGVWINGSMFVIEWSWCNMAAATPQLRRGGHGKYHSGGVRWRRNIMSILTFHECILACFDCELQRVDRRVLLFCVRRLLATTILGAVMVRLHALLCDQLMRSVMLQSIDVVQVMDWRDAMRCDHWWHATRSMDEMQTLQCHAINWCHVMLLTWYFWPRLKRSRLNWSEKTRPCVTQST